MEEITKLATPWAVYAGRAQLAESVLKAGGVLVSSALA